MAKRSLAVVIAIVLGTVVVLALTVPPGAIAQGCAMCYQSAAASGARAIAALRSGIVILMIAPAIICAGIAYLAYRRRNLHDQSQ